MAEERLNLSTAPNIDYHIVTLFEKLESLRNEKSNNKCASKPSIKVEIRSLEFWKSVFSECLASFVYVFVVCGAKAGAFARVSVPSISFDLLSTALAAGFVMLSLTQCFGHISGAHVNPAVTIAMGITKNISFLRTKMFVIAQCGGAIAGAAFLYGVSVPRNQEDPELSLLMKEAPWEKFGIEFILTFVVVLSYFVSMDGERRWMGMSAITIGSTYSACSFVSPTPYLNPARSLGPSFVLKKWDNHWVYWIGPIIGGIAAGLIYEYIFNSKRHKQQNSTNDGESSSIQSDEDTYDDLDKPTGPKYQESTYNTYRTAGATNGPTGYFPSLTSASLYSAPATKLERVESLYGGTRSLYCKSPPLTRANLNRSQSVYTKSNSGVNRDFLPKPGPLVPAQSLYPIKLNQQTHVQNQNLQNQLQQRSESVYGVRGNISRPDNLSTTERAGYTNKNTPLPNDNNPKHEENKNSSKGNRPESMYGVVSLQRRGGQSVQSDDSSFGSYQGPSNRNNSYSNNSSFQNKSSNAGTSYISRNAGLAEGRPLPPSSQGSSTSNSYYQSFSQHSPTSQY